MIVCSCHCLSHRDVCRAIASGATRPCEVYEHCGKRAECGGCVRSILGFLRDQMTPPPIAPDGWLTAAAP